MNLRKIKLVNFRNYRRTEISFDKYLNIIIGKNAQGKTNILESIYVLGLTKSYKPQQSNNLIKNDEEKSIITGEIKVAKVYKKLSVDLDRKSKKVYLNDNELKKISQYIGNLNVILSSPEDINIIKGSPAERRNLLNLEISQISQKYLINLNEYNKLLKIRNDYLKQLSTKFVADYKYLEVLTRNLISRAVIICKERAAFIDEINKNILNVYKTIMGEGELQVEYENSIDYLANEEEIYKFYETNKEKEIYQGMTLYGPHRDDIKFILNSEDIKFFGSQGQQKLAMISFKLTEINVFRKITEANPILLIDDLFSEIDSQKRNRLIDFISDDIQVIITANDLRGINKRLLERAKIFEIENAEIKEKVKK